MNATNSICLLVKRIMPRQTSAFDTYWYFASERQKMFFQRLYGAPPPWTEDKILQKYKFTNAYRASDRVSQYLIKRVIYDSNRSPKDLLFRILLFKTFNKIDTWEALEKEFGEVNVEGYSFEAYNSLLSRLAENGTKIYSGAYIMASGKQAFGCMKKHSNHLRMIELILRDELHKRIQEMRSMQQLYNKLLSYPTIGRFLAYQYAIDINYSTLSSFSEMEFVMPGPGARDGIRKCFNDIGEWSESDVIRYVTERQEREFERLGLDFISLWNRPLQLIDCQNLFCEVDKYTRASYPELNGISGRKRIKRKFVPTNGTILPWYPPKWGINEKISGDMGRAIIDKRRNCPPLS